MNKYILDTDIVSYLWDEKSVHHRKVVEHLNSLDDEDIVGISVVSIYELTYGMDSFQNEELKAIFKNALEFLQNDQDANIFSLDTNGATFFSQLKLKYKNATGIKSKEAKKGILHPPTKRDDTFSPKKIDNTPPLAPKAFKKTYIANTLKGKN
jgi:predicted nucleic acid-binding protein